MVCSSVMLLGVFLAIGTLLKRHMTGALLNFQNGRQQCYRPIVDVDISIVFFAAEVSIMLKTISGSVV